MINNIDQMKRLRFSAIGVLLLGGFGIIVYGLLSVIGNEPLVNVLGASDRRIFVYGIVVRAILLMIQMYLWFEISFLVKGREWSRILTLIPIFVSVFILTIGQPPIGETVRLGFWGVLALPQLWTLLLSVGFYLIYRISGPDGPLATIGILSNFSVRNSSSETLDGKHSEGDDDKRD